MLTLTASEEVTVKLAGGAEIDLAPPSPRIVAAGRQASRRALDDDADLSGAMAMVAFSEGVLRAAILRWRGIGGADGEALDCTSETVALALRDIGIFDALDAGYVIPMMARETEKNVSAASSAGTSKRATAGKDIAGSAAATKPKPKRKRTATSRKAIPAKGAPRPQTAKR